jgi:hypothetical protein
MTKIFKVYVVLLILTTTTLFAQEKTILLVETDVQPAKFDNKYRKIFNDSIIVETTAVRELVYILMALTDFAKNDYGIVNKRSPYYKYAMAHFEPYKNDRLVQQMNNLVSNNMDDRMLPEINATAFYFTKKGKIKRHKYYTNIRGNKDVISPLIKELERFAEETEFLKFFNSDVTQVYYKEIQNFYRNEANIKRMVNWLRTQFPSVSLYNSIKVVATPLVRGWEHEDVVADKGFSQIIVHPSYLPASEKASVYSRETQLLLRTDMLFTELNHGSINPVSENYSNDINKAFEGKLTLFIKNDGGHSEYLNPVLAFEEYMNWGLVALYANDVLPLNEKYLLENSTLEMMEMRSEFPAFKDFLPFLLQVYRTKGVNETVESQFPKLINWFKEYKEQK